MTDGIKVSVIVPTHNRCRLLARLLASIERQTLPRSEYEVIIVHNHTDDGTQAMAEAWCAGRSGRARYHRKQFSGPARSRDFGARTAMGRYLAFIDDDCEAAPDWLAAGVAMLESDTGTPALGLVQGTTLPMPGAKRPLLSKTIEIRGPTPYFETCNIFYRTSIFLAVGGFNGAFIDRFYGEDTDLGWRLAGAGHATGFCADARVYHEVFRVSLRRWLMEPWHFRNLPLLVRIHPGLRAHMYWRHFLSIDTCLFNLLPLSGVLGLVWGWGALLFSLPYFLVRYRGGGHVGPAHLRLARVVMGIPRGTVAWAALALGSLRARTWLL